MGLNESPSEKEGKFDGGEFGDCKEEGLNESPSEKEGKFAAAADLDGCVDAASMKALPKRKGNLVMSAVACGLVFSLNESPSEKEGK